MLERKFQTQLIDELERLFPGCLILKNDEQWLQGIPDPTICGVATGRSWKVSGLLKHPLGPNQAYYIEVAQKMSFGAFYLPRTWRPF